MVSEVVNMVSYRRPDLAAFLICLVFVLSAIQGEGICTNPIGPPLGKEDNFIIQVPS